MQPEENNPTQNTNPEPTPLPSTNNSPQSSSYAERTIQPLSIEADIRTAASSAANIITPPLSNTLSTPSAPASPTTDSVDTNPVPTLSVPPQSIATTASFQADLPPIPENEPINRKGKGLKVFIVIFLVLVGLGAGGYFLLTRGGDPANLPAAVNPTTIFSGRITESDLVAETTPTTTYLRPKQWIQKELAGGVGYGTTEESHNRPLALVTLIEGAKDTKLANASKETYDKLRAATVQGLKDTLAIQSSGMQNDASSCTSQPTVDIQPGTKETDTIVTIATATMTCTRDDGEYIAETLFLVGRDGQQRSFAVAATGEEWDKNKAVFQKILDSVAQITN